MWPLTPTNFSSRPTLHRILGEFSLIHINFLTRLWLQHIFCLRSSLYFWDATCIDKGRKHLFPSILVTDLLTPVALAAVLSRQGWQNIPLFLFLSGSNPALHCIIIQWFLIHALWLIIGEVVVRLRAFMPDIRRTRGIVNSFCEGWGANLRL